MAAATPEGKGGEAAGRVVKRVPVRHSRARMQRGEEETSATGLRAHPHVVYFAGAASWAAFVAFVATLLIRHNDLPASTDWKIVGGGVLVALAGTIGPGLRWARTWIEIDSTHARYSGGLFWRTTVDVGLERARGVAIEQSFLGRLLGYGRLRVVDEAGGAHVFPPVGDLDTVRAAITRRESRARGRQGRRGDG
jgi:hypothetical protein